MTKYELKKRYDKLVSEIEGAKIYDGRNKGIDVYVCKKCGSKLYTRYKDKGVTPFVMACRNTECKDIMNHQFEISLSQAEGDNITVHNWVRPDFRWLDNQRKKDRMGIIEHVLNGGLILDDEL